ncbi:MAG: acetyl-CoA carboxylase biotin carboxyl carrier protein [Candidatus Ozemobacteraceae bacterium]
MSNKVENKLAEANHPHVETSEAVPTADSAVDNVLQIIRLMAETDLAELELESPHLKIALRRGIPVIDQQVAQHSTEPQATYARISVPAARDASVRLEAVPVTQKPAIAPDAHYHKVVSPMAGTFYQAPSPSSPAYVKEGDQVNAGQPVCIVEAMKLMNEIKSDKAGKIARIVAVNAQSVEKGTVLFLIDTGV